MNIDTKFEIGQEVYYNGPKSPEEIKVGIAEMRVADIFAKDGSGKAVTLQYSIVEVDKQEILGPCSWCHCYEDELTSEELGAGWNS